MHDSSSEEEEEEVPVNVLSKVLYMVTLYSKYTSIFTQYLTYETGIFLTNH